MASNKILPASSLKVESVYQCFRVAFNVAKTRAGVLAKSLAHAVLPLYVLDLLLKLAALAIAPTLPPPPPLPPLAPWGSLFVPPPPLPPLSPLSAIINLARAVIGLAVMVLVIPVTIHVTASHLIGEKAEVRGALKAARSSWLRIFASQCALFAVLFGTYLLLVVIASLVTLLFAPHLLSQVLATHPLPSLSGEPLTSASSRMLLSLVNDPPPVDPKVALIALISMVVISITIIILCIRYAFIAHVSVMGPDYGFGALTRSASLSKSFRLYIFRYNYLCFLLALFIVAPVSFTSGAMEMRFLTSDPKKWSLLPGIALFTLALDLDMIAFQVFSTIGLTVLYFGAREFHEKTPPAEFNLDTLSAFVHGNIDRALYAPIDPAP